MWQAQQTEERKKPNHTTTTQQKCESRSKMRGSIRETPKTAIKGTRVPMYLVLLHLSCTFSVNTGVFSRQLKAAEAAGQCWRWQHAEEERCNTRHLLCQTRCFHRQTYQLWMYDVSARLVLQYSDCFYTMSHHVHKQQIIRSTGHSCSTGHVS